jgi:hypothetical protein
MLGTKLTLKTGLVSDLGVKSMVFCDRAVSDSEERDKQNIPKLALEAESGGRHRKDRSLQGLLQLRPPHGSRGGQTRGSSRNPFLPLK